MIQNSQNEQLQKISIWISPRLEKYEVIIFIAFLVALFLKATTSLPLGLAFIILLLSLAILYFFSAFAPTTDKVAGGLEIFILKLAAIGSSIGVIGIMFILMNFPGSRIMIYDGCLVLILLIPIILIIRSRKPDLKIFSSRLLLRIFLVAAIGFGLTFSSASSLRKIGVVKNPVVEERK